MQIRIDQAVDALHGVETKEIDADRLPPFGGGKHECDECGVDCSGGRSSFAIDWKGTMTPCTRFDAISADALRQGFKNAWEHVSREAGSWPRVPECDGCAYSDVCYNCPAVMLQYAEPGKQPVKLYEQTRCYVQHGIRHIPDCD